MDDNFSVGPPKCLENKFTWVMVSHNVPMATNNALLKNGVYLKDTHISPGSHHRIRIQNLEPN